MAFLSIANLAQQSTFGIRSARPTQEFVFNNNINPGQWTSTPWSGVGGNDAWLGFVLGRSSPRARVHAAGTGLLAAWRARRVSTDSILRIRLLGDGEVVVAEHSEVGVLAHVRRIRGG